MERPKDFSYVGNQESNMYFYSVPTSPTGRGVSALFGFETEPPSPRTYEDANSSSGDDFEFETSRRFNVETSQNFENPFDHRQQQQQQQQQQKQQVESGDSLPTAMAFADELFCDGRVLPLTPPLKLPPRLQNLNSKSGGNRSSSASSPRSPSSVLKLSFSRRSLWNDDFDPFVVALENVREEKRGKTRDGNNHRRARSLSPFRTTKQKQVSNDSVGLSSTMLREPNSSAQVGQSPKMLEEPRGLSFARQVRLVKIDHELPTKPNLEARENARESGEPCIRESKRQKMKKFLFKSSSMREVNNRDKVNDQNATSWKATFLKKFSFKSTTSARYNGDTRVAKVTKMAMIHYRPRLPLCMGLGQGM